MVKRCLSPGWLNLKSLSRRRACGESRIKVGSLLTRRGKDFVQVGGDIHSGTRVRRYDWTPWSRKSSFMDLRKHVKVSYLRARMDEVLGRRR